MRILTAETAKKNGLKRFNLPVTNYWYSWMAPKDRKVIPDPIDDREFQE